MADRCKELRYGSNLEGNMRWILAIAILFCSCLYADDVNQAPALVEVTRKDYVIQFPVGWKIKPGENDGDVYAISPNDRVADSFHENVNVLIDNEATNMSLDEYYTASLNGLKTLATDFKLQENGVTQVGDEKARWLLFTHRAGVYTFKVLQYMIVANHRAYLITCTATQDTFAQYEPQFKAIVKTFRLLPPATGKTYGDSASPAEPSPPRPDR